MSKKSYSVVIKNKIKSFKKIISVDSDKSLSIRYLLIGAISEGISEIRSILESDDVFSCIYCLKKLGVKIRKSKEKKYLIYGKGLGSLHIKKGSTLNFGNSGTLARLLIGILSSTPNIEVKIKGDSSLNKRSMSKLISLMNEFGAEFYPKRKVNFPLKIVSSAIPVGINYNAGVSAQLKSAVILAGLNSYGVTNIFEQHKSRDHTENILEKNSTTLKKKNKNIKIYGKSFLNSIKAFVPGDPSSAAFMTSLTLLSKKSELLIKGVGLNKKRIGFYKLMKKCGAKIQFKNITKKNNEIFGDIKVKSSKLKPINANAEYYVSSTDEYPIMFVIAALTPGTSVFKGIGDLVNKESNRIDEMKKILKQIGIKFKSNKDDMKIFGQKIINYKSKKIIVPSLGDHRICMSAMILALTTGIATNIKNFETVKTSSPSFLKLIKNLGGKFEIK